MITNIPIIAILLSLITFTSGEITYSYTLEGNHIQMYLSYRCHDSEFVTLQRPYRAPFYNSAKPESMILLPNQELSFHEASGECVITLHFAPVLRSDGGEYILTLYTHDRTLLWKRIRLLVVDYPPGTASCEVGGGDNVDDWVLLNCKAPAGSMSGIIACYQNGYRVPHLKAPVELDGTLEQTLWVRYSQPAFCCAVAIGHPVDRCDCKDYTWDPYKNITDPCPLTTPQHDPTPPQSYTPLPTTNPTKQGNTEKPSSNDTLQLTFHLPLGALVLAAICLTIALILSHRRASKLIMRMEYMKKKFGRNLNDYHDSEEDSERP